MPDRRAHIYGGRRGGSMRDAGMMGVITDDVRFWLGDGGMGRFARRRRHGRFNITEIFSKNEEGEIRCETMIETPSLDSSGMVGRFVAFDEAAPLPASALAITPAMRRDFLSGHWVDPGAASQPRREETTATTGPASYDFWANALRQDMMEDLIAPRRGRGLDNLIKKKPLPIHSRPIDLPTLTHIHGPSPGHPVDFRGVRHFHEDDVEKWGGLTDISLLCRVHDFDEMKTDLSDEYHWNNIEINVEKGLVGANLRKFLRQYGAREKRK